MFPRTGAPGDYELLPSNHEYPNLMPLSQNEFWLPNNRTVQAVAKMRRRVGPNPRAAAEPWYKKIRGSWPFSRSR